jgi:hypothetical protein
MINQDIQVNILFFFIMKHQKNNKVVSTCKNNSNQGI